MNSTNYLNDLPFSDIKNVDEDLFLRPGVYTPFDNYLMYPSGMLP